MRNVDDPRVNLYDFIEYSAAEMMPVIIEYPNKYLWARTSDALNLELIPELFHTA